MEEVNNETKTGKGKMKRNENIGKKGVKSINN